MKRFLVPTDFTEVSRNAGRFAAGLAKATGARLQLLHVYSPLPATALVPESWVLPTEEIGELLQQELRQEAEQVKAIIGAEVECELLEGGTEAAIAQMARERQADLIIMGAHDGQRHPVWGSTIYKTIRETDVPQLIVPENASFQPFRNIVLAVDFDEMTGPALFKPLHALYKHFGATLQVVHVQRPGATVQDSEVPQRLQLDRSLERFKYQYETIMETDVVTGIEHFLSRRPADLFVMIAHHKNLFQRLFGDVHTRALSFELSIPLLVLKQPDRQVGR